MTRVEAEEEGDKEAIDFKNSLFAHAFMGQNPDLFMKLYPQDFGMAPEEEQWLEPELPMGDAFTAERMLADLRATGWDG